MNKSNKKNAAKLTPWELVQRKIAERSEQPLPKQEPMRVMAICFVDVKIEGVEAVVAIPAGWTAAQTLDSWLEIKAKQEEIPTAELEGWLEEERNSYMFEELDLITPENLAAKEIPPQRL